MFAWYNFFPDLMVHRFFYCCLFKLCHFCLRLLPLIGGYLSSINTRIISFKIDHLLFRPREELDQSMSVADTSSSGYVMSGTLLRFHSVSSWIGAPSKHRYVHVVSRVKLRPWLCLFFRCQTGICSLISKYSLWYREMASILHHFYWWNDCRAVSGTRMHVGSSPKVAYRSRKSFDCIVKRLAWPRLRQRRIQDKHKPHNI